MQVSDTILPTLKAFEHRAVQLDTFPAILNFDLTADSVSLQYKVNFSSGDTIESSHGNIDFRVNNKLCFTYILSNYYAYDDGLAEYSAGLVDPGNELAYRFDMKTNSQDTINGVFINFPAFTGTSANSLDFFILDDNDGKPGNILYEQSIDIVLNAGNEFKLNTLIEGVIVQNAFYIGYREPSTGSVQIGLDKSNDTGNQMYYRLTENGQWQLNDRVTGSLIIRPRFGIAPVVTSVYESQHPVSIYPNPNRGEFYVKGPIEQLRVISITGQPVNTAIEDVGDNKRVNVTTAATGLYIVQYKSGSKVFTEKIFITK